MDDDAPRVFTGRLELVAADAAGWGSWQVVEVSRQLAVGRIELTAPDGDGCVECRLTVEDKWQKKGYATEALGGLIDWAFSHEEVRRIRAEAPRRVPASIRVLEKNGLSHVGDGRAPDTLRFELARPE
ncbi:MAG TPA: GNAT family protein [Polyangia bacterium]